MINTQICLMTWMILREPPFVENPRPVIIQKHQPKDTMLDKTRSQRFLKVSQFLIILELFRFSITVNAVVGRRIFDTLTLCGDGACWEIPRCEPCPLGLAFRVPCGREASCGPAQVMLPMRECTMDTFFTGRHVFHGSYYL